MSDVRLLLGDCRTVLAELPAESVDSCCTDPPYDLTTAKRFGKPGAVPAKGNPVYARHSRGFMGKEWDGTGVAFDPATWAEVLRVLKPGAHLLAFGGSRTWHRLTCAIEDAGFEVRDSLAWLYGSGFPKSHDVSKALDRQAGAVREVVATHAEHDITRQNGGGSERLMSSAGNRETREVAVTAPATDLARQWDGWGTALKPAFEPIVLARKPLSESSVAANVMRWGTGALNVKACRLGDEPIRTYQPNGATREGKLYGKFQGGVDQTHEGRWPPNVLLDEEAAGLVDQQSGERTSGELKAGTLRTVTPANIAFGKDKPGRPAAVNGFEANTGGASRFFYVAKASRSERDKGCELLPDTTRNRVNPGGLEHDPKWAPVQAKNGHPTVKPLTLLRWLVRLITPPEGHVLDPFMGSGSVGVACELELFGFVGIEREADYYRIAQARLAADRNLFVSSAPAPPRAPHTPKEP